MYAYQFAKALYLADRHNWTRFVTMQPHFNLLYREEEREMLRLCQEERIGVLPWSPLARGRLARPWAERSETNRGQSDTFGKKLYSHAESADENIVNAVQKIAEQRGIPMSQVALAWVRQQPTITAPIVGATKLHQLEDAVASLDLTLSKEECEQLEAPYIPHEISIG